MEQPSDKTDTPLDLLTRQTGLLAQILEQQKNLLMQQSQFVEMQTKLVSESLELAKKQTKYLGNISTVATLIGILILLSICAWIFGTFILI